MDRQKSFTQYCISPPDYEDLKKSQLAEQEDVYREVDESHRRRKVIIIFGIPQNESGSIDERRQSNMKTMQDIDRNIGVDSLKPEDASKIGRVSDPHPCLLRFKCKSTMEKALLIHLSKCISTVTSISDGHRGF